MSLPVAIVDAFTTTPGQGNRAGVVTEARGLDAAAMVKAASAVAASETAFVFRDRDTLRLRYFTPEAEIPFCGHATVATMHYLAETGEDSGPGKIEIQCGIGSLNVEIDGDRTVWIDAGAVEWSECGDALEQHALALLESVPPLRDASLPVLKSRGILYVPLARREDLWRLSPDWDRLAGLKSAEDIMGVYAFTLETVEPGNVSHGRFFAPAVGIREDPVTGAASVPLADYLARFGIIKLPAEGGTVRARAEQGDAMGKPGRVELEVTGAPGNVQGVRIGGRAVTVIEGTLR
jgi:PhzF family phenazine biosynthesis protein